MSKLGPNPKLRNLSRGYKEARGDLIWILDCNIWVRRETCRRMVDLLLGQSNDPSKRLPAKLVHQLPIAVVIDPATQMVAEPALTAGLPNIEGAHVECMFLSTSHAQFYTAINAVAISPCLVGKSNMFRRSHLESLTNRDPSRSSGIDFFSWHICEDHMIGDLLWRQPVPEALRVKAIGATAWTNHALLRGYPAFQPLCRMSIQQYKNRRARWLTARKWTVTLATAIEPGTEAFMCSLIGATGMAFQLGSISPAGRLMSTGLLWLASIAAWAAVDWWLSGMLSEATLPAGMQPVSRPRGIARWLRTWTMREGLALPIWLQGVCFSNTVRWRGTNFKVGPDMKARIVGGEGAGEADYRSYEARRQGDKAE